MRFPKWFCATAAGAAAMTTPLVSYAQLGADRVVTNKVYQTTAITNEAWARRIVSELRSGDDATLRDLSGRFASAAHLRALGVSMEHAHEVAEAWMQGFASGTNMLAAAMSQAPTNGILMQLTYPLEPSSVRRSVDIFVVSNEYDSARNRDCLWIYFSRVLPMKPVMSVPYIWESGFSTNRATGAFHVSDIPSSHWTNTVDIVRFGQTYAECHPCWFPRPAALADTPVFLARHGRFGGTEGIEWGSIAVTVDGAPTYTGAVTNLAADTAIVFSNGGYVGTIQLEEGQ